MIMEILKEITDWDVDFRQPNHTYLINRKGLVLAYAKWHDEIHIFQNRQILNKRYRKFVRNNHEGLSKLIKKFEQEENSFTQNKNIKCPNTRSFKVKSKEKEYIVQYNTLTKYFSCSCVGFGYRRKCKHVESVSKKLEEQV